MQHYQNIRTSCDNKHSAAITTTTLATTATNIQQQLFVYVFGVLVCECKAGSN